MTTKFLFMLTHHDVTVANAIEVFEGIKNAGLECVGFKDIGLEEDELLKLIDLMKKEKMKTFMEVVSFSKEEHLKAANRASQLGVDYLIGGMPPYTKLMLEFLRKEGVKTKYFPYAGKIREHPCILDGTIEEIIQEAKEAEALGVDGINLLAYRYVGDIQQLLTRFREAVSVPVIIAGSIDSFERIDEVVSLKYWGFTIGGAVFEKKFVPKGSIREQLISVLKALE